MINLDQQTSATLQETLYSAVLPSGLHIFILPRKGYAKKFASFATRYGSIDNCFKVPGETDWTRVPDGIAHFLEHQLFAQEYGDAFEKFSELGASANAFTTYNSTTYLFSATENFSQSLELLLDFVQTPYFTDQGTDKERGIIIQEINMYHDNPGWRLGQNLREHLFSKHPFRIDIAGTAETVRQITTEMLIKCYETFYHPDNMVVSVVGDVDPRQVVEQVAESVEKRGLKPRSPIQRQLVDEPAAVVSRRAVDRMAVARPIVAIGFKDIEQTGSGRDIVKKELLTDVALQVLFGPSSPFYDRLYQEGLIDDSFSASYYGERGFGMTTVSGETDRPEELAEAVLAEVRRAAETGLESNDVERVRRSLYGEMVGTFDSVESLSYLLNNSFFRDVQLFDPLQVLEKIDVNQVNERVRQHLLPELHAVSIINP